MSKVSIPSKVLLIENSSADFLKARIPLYHFLQQKGFDVYALVPNDGFINQIQEQEVKVIEYTLNRRDKGIVQLIKLIFIYAKIIRTNNFDLIHSFRFQPNLINVLANFFNRRKLVLHITGLGIAFSNTSFLYRCLRLLSQLLFQVKLIRAQKVIVQNDDDAKDIWFHAIWKRKLVLIPGSGVNTNVFDTNRFDREKLRQNAHLTDEVICICVTRLIWEKGIVEMVDAFKEMVIANPRLKLWIVGWSDTDNPRHVNEEYIESYRSDPTVHFMGRRNEVTSLLAMADIFVYPSYYREGIPRGILESLSMGLPVITTNMPGCNLTVNEGVNGFLIRPRSKEAIQKAVLTMLAESRFKKMGLHSRQLAENKFSESIVFSQIAELYYT